MNIFGRSADELVFDLIQQDNPDITPKLSGMNCYLSNGQVNTDSDAAQYNTKNHHQILLGNYARKRSNL